MLSWSFLRSQETDAVVVRLPRRQCSSETCAMISGRGSQGKRDTRRSDAEPTWRSSKHLNGTCASDRHSVWKGAASNPTRRSTSSSQASRLAGGVLYSPRKASNNSLSSHKRAETACKHACDPTEDVEYQCGPHGKAGKKACHRDYRASYDPAKEKA